MLTWINHLSGAYTTLVIVLDLAGNGFVIFATVARNAIKLDKMSVWIIQNLAVVDIANAIFVFIPAATTYFTDGMWMLGPFICKLIFGYKYSFAIGNIYLIIFLSLNKLVRCLFPLRNLVSTRSQRLSVTITILILMLIGPTRKLYAAFISRKAIVRFSEVHSTCIAFEAVEGVEKPFQPGVDKFMLLIFVVIPVIVLIAVNAGLVCFAVRSTKRKVNRKNVLIVILVTLSFVATFTPFTALYQKYGNSFHEAPVGLRIGLFVGFISSFINPAIYILTNETFRVFTKRSMAWLSYSLVVAPLGCLRNKMQSVSIRVLSKVGSSRAMRRRKTLTTGNETVVQQSDTFGSKQREKSESSEKSGRKDGEKMIGLVRDIPEKATMKHDDLKEIVSIYLMSREGGSVLDLAVIEKPSDNKDSRVNEDAVVNSDGTITQDSSGTEVAAKLEINEKGFPVDHKEGDEGCVKEIDDVDPKNDQVEKSEGQRKDGHT